MVALRCTSSLACALLVVILTLLGSTHQAPAEGEGVVDVECEPLTLLEGSGDDVDLVIIEPDEDPRGIVLRRWRRFIRSVLFHPFRPIRKMVAAMVIPGTIAGAIAGTVASSIVGVGAGGVTGGIAGAGLGGLGGILVPAFRLKGGKFKKKDTDIRSKLTGKKKKKKKESVDDDEEEEDEEEDEDDYDDEDDEADESEDEERSSNDLGRNAPFNSNLQNDDSENMVLLLRGAINVDRLYELRKKMKLLKIKKKFQSKQRHILWN